MIDTCVAILLGDDYKVLHGLGEGAYGTVVAALHKPTNREVAIKKVLPFEHTLFCLRTLRELKLLKFLSEAGVSENVRPTLPYPGPSGTATRSLTAVRLSVPRSSQY